MAKKTSVRMYVKAISILERADHDWAEGMSDPLIGEVVQKAKADFLYEMYKAERENVAEETDSDIRQGKKKNQMSEE